MELNTTIIDINGSILVRIPPAMVEFYGLKDKPRPGKCQIHEINKNEVKLVFG